MTALDKFRLVWRAFFGERPTIVEDAQLLGFPEAMKFSRSRSGMYCAVYRNHEGRGETRLEAARAAMKSWRGGES